MKFNSLQKKEEEHADKTSPLSYFKALATNFKLDIDLLFMIPINSTEPLTYTTMREMSSSDNLNYTYEDYGDLIKLENCPLAEYNLITAVCFFVICCFSFLGNTMLLYSLVRFEDLKRVTMLFLLCLAVFDMLFTMTLPFWAIYNLKMKWIFEDLMCKVLTGAYFVGIYGSLILLTAMTVDCFLFIVVRGKWFTRRRRLICAKLAVACSWIISVSACLPDALHSEGKNQSCKSMSPENNPAGYYTQFTMLFAIPLVIIVLCYGKILHTLMSSSGQRRYKTLLVVLLIIMAFVVCWGPYHFIIIMMPLFDHVMEDCNNKIKLNQTFVICRIIAYSHCCINPLLFLIRGRSKKFLSRLLFCQYQHRSGEASDRSSDPSHFSIHRHLSVAAPQTVTELKSL